MKEFADRRISFDFEFLAKAAVGEFLCKYTRNEELKHRTILPTEHLCFALRLSSFNFRNVLAYVRFV